MTSSEAIATHLPGNANSFLTFQLPYKLTYTEPVYIRVESLTVPVSWYSIDSDNDTLNYSTNGINRTFTFEHGNYDMYEITQQLNTAMTSYSVAVVYNESTNRVTFTYSGSGSFSLLSTSTCFKILGFDESTYIGTPLTSVNICDTVRVMRLMLVSQSIQLINFTSNRVPYSGILAGIPVNNVFNSILDYRARDEMLTQSNEFFQMTFQLLDEEMMPIDLNGGQWTLSLSFITY